MAALRALRSHADASVSNFAAETLAALEPSAETGLPPACPTSLVATFLGFSILNDLVPAPPVGAQGAEFATAVEKARSIELLICSRLASRGDFSEGVECSVGSKKGQLKRWFPLLLDDASSDNDFLSLKKLLQEAEASGLSLDTTLGQILKSNGH